MSRVNDAVLDDLPAYVLETLKPDENSNYSMVRFFIDKDICLPVRTEFIGLNGELRKELVIDREQVQMVDEHWVPFLTTMTDLKLGTKSIATVEEVEIDPELSSGMFEVNSLKAGGH